MKMLLCLLAIAFLSTSLAGADEKAAEKKTKKPDYNVVTQIGLVVRDVEKSAKAYADLFGVDVPEITITDPFEKANTQYRGEPTQGQAKLAFFHLENIQIELIEPVGGPSTWRDVLEEQGECVHHIAFNVKGMDKNIAMLEKKGGKLVQRGEFTGGGYAYVDLTEQLAVMIELLTFGE